MVDKEQKNEISIDIAQLINDYNLYKSGLAKNWIFFFRKNPTQMGFFK